MSMRTVRLAPRSGGAPSLSETHPAVLAGDRPGEHRSQLLDSEERRALKIAAEEFIYWRDAEDVDGIAFGAMNASADILARIADPNSAARPGELLENSRNGELLASFVQYCLLHPEESFSEALMNWETVR